MTTAVLYRQTLGRAWRGSWVPVARVAVVALGAVLALLLFSTGPKSNDYLDPADGSFGGAKALAQILTQRGYRVDEVYSPADALAAPGPHGAGPFPVTLVITSPDLLTAGQRRQLARADADLVLVAPGAASLRTLAPSVTVVNAALPVQGAVEPSCALAGARL